MPSRRINIKELLWFTLPCLLLAGLAIWFQQRAKSTSAHNSTTQPGLRVEIVRLEKVPLTPLESWQGFKWKVILHQRIAGQDSVPGKIQLKQPTVYTPQVKLVWKKHGQQKVTSRVLTRKWDAQQRLWRTDAPLFLDLEPLPNQSDSTQFIHSILCSDADFPPGGEVFLEGTAIARGNAWLDQRLTSPFPGIKKWIWMRRNWHEYEIEAAPAKFVLPVREYGSSGTTLAINQPTPVIIDTPQSILIPTPDRLRVRAGYAMGFRLKKPTLPNPPENAQWRLGQFEILDAQRRPLPGSSQDDFRSELRKQHDDSPNEVSGVVWLRKTTLPPQAVYLSAWASFADSWPVQIQVHLKQSPSWEQQSCGELLRFISATQTETGVEVTLQYLGKKKLMLDYLVGNDMDLDHPWKKTTPAKLDPNVDYLITNWDQHLEPISPQKSLPKVIAAGTMIDSNTITVVYQFPYGTRPVSPQQKAVFKAKVGLRNRGFIQTVVQVSLSHPQLPTPTP